ncbi:B-box zinc finger family protein [Balamuthia mandrillaris]
MDQLFPKIRALHATNEEIIARVENISEVKQYSYHIKNKGDELYVGEVVTSLQVPNLLKTFRCGLEMKTEIWDIFNDKPNWGCSSWSDLKRLNNELLLIVEKFELLDRNNTKVQGELAKYLHNFEIIQLGLGKAEELTLSQQSRKEYFEEKVARINGLISEVKEEGAKIDLMQTTNAHRRPATTRVWYVARDSLAKED